MPSPDDQCCVYYISDANCTDPYRHGYVGLTSNEVTRRYNHRRSGRWPLAQPKIQRMTNYDNRRIDARRSGDRSEPWQGHHPRDDDRKSDDGL